MAKTIFIADLHLSDDEVVLCRLFQQSLQRWQGQIDALYILGDLFDVWIGDDALNESSQQVMQSLKTFTQSCPVYFIAGNRDFLIGEDFFRQTGVQKLPEIMPISLYGKHYLLSHGDEMCTADISYLRFRSVIRKKWMQTLLLSLPIGLRQKIAAKMRTSSQQRKKMVGLSPISDITEQGLQSNLHAYPATQIVIHGHTHRPAHHLHEWGERKIERFVLPDWRNQYGACLVVEPEHIYFETLK